jgi:hypothetical protein
MRSGLGSFCTFRKVLILLCALVSVGPVVAADKKIAPSTSDSGHVQGKVAAPSVKSDSIPAKSSSVKSSSAKSSSAKSGLAPGKTSLQARSSRLKTSRTSSTRSGTKGRVRKTKARGQQGIDGRRARQIQEALIREKYLEGEPSGTWDQRTRDAMARFQDDNGWQRKVVPDSRALIKLGLGPSHANLITPLGSDASTLLPDSAREMQPGGAQTAVR